METKNKIDRLAALVGGKAVLAFIISRDPAIVSRMARDGKLRTEFNNAIRYHLQEARYSRETTAEILSLLEPEICPNCGQPLPVGGVV